MVRFLYSNNNENTRHQSLYSIVHCCVQTIPYAPLPAMDAKKMQSIKSMDIKRNQGNPGYPLLIHPLCIMKSKIRPVLAVSIWSSLVSTCSTLPSDSTTYLAESSGVFFLQTTSLLHGLLQESLLNDQVWLWVNMEHITQLNLFLRQ